MWCDVFVSPGLGGLVVEEDFMSRETILVCGDRAAGDHGFTDNQYGNCEFCRKDIQWRPTDVEVGTRLCLGCATAMMSRTPDVEKLIQPMPAAYREELKSRGYTDEMIDWAVAQMVKMVTEG
jgi:hypothetical protein